MNVLLEYIRDLEVIALVVTVSDLEVKGTYWLDLDDIKVLYAGDSNPGQMNFLEQNISNISSL